MKKLLLFLVLPAFIFSCKKNKEEDPAPQLGSNYRVKYIEYTDPVTKAVTTKGVYTYNTSERVTKIAVLNASNDTTSVSLYEYNDKGLVSRFSNSSEPVCYVYAYTSDSLVESVTRYRNAAGTSLDYTTYYYYNSTRDLTCKVKRFENSFTVRDSLVLFDYVNGRPTTADYYQKTDGDYFIVGKRKYTYDTYMNRIKTETTPYENVTQFYTASTAVFDTEQNHELLNNILGGINVSIGGSEDYINNNSRNSDKSYEEGFSQYFECGLSSSRENKIETKNDAGLPLTIRSISNRYTCGVLQTGSPSELLMKIYYRRF